MATNNIIRFRKEDYPDSPSWWDRAIYNMNLLVDYIYAINTTVTANTASLKALPKFYTTTFTQTSSATSTTVPSGNTYSFTNPYTTVPKQLLIYATNSANPVFTSPVWASWHVASGKIYIDAITGLANSTQYNFTVTLIV